MNWQILACMGFFFVLSAIVSCAPQPVPGIPNNPSVKPEFTTTPDHLPTPSQTRSPTLMERTARPTEALPSGVEWVPTTPAPVTGEVPDEILEPILDDLVRRVNVDRTEVQVIRAEAVVWNDGSLGCPQSGVFYTQAIVNGYWVVGEVNGQKYDYRVTSSGHFMLCDQGFPLLTPPGTPES